MVHEHDMRFCEACQQLGAFDGAGHVAAGIFLAVAKAQHERVDDDEQDVRARLCILLDHTRCQSSHMHFVTQIDRGRADPVGLGVRSVLEPGHGAVQRRVRCLRGEMPDRAGTDGKPGEGASCHDRCGERHGKRGFSRV